MNLHLKWVSVDRVSSLSTEISFRIFQIFRLKILYFLQNGATFSRLSGKALITLGER